MMEKGKWEILAILFVLAMIGSFVVIINFDSSTNEALRSAIQSNPNEELRITNYELKAKW